VPLLKHSPKRTDQQRNLSGGVNEKLRDLSSEILSLIYAIKH
jgi:hypothetical protein